MNLFDWRKQLPGTDVVTTQIGFGCGRLFRDPNRKSRMNLLSYAYDSGIRHFDVARSYGLGEAESDLGSFLRGRRSECTITTKFGAGAPSSLSLVGKIQKPMRQVLRWFPQFRRFAPAKKMTSLRFSVKDSEKSFEVSLRKLNTDYVDILLLHDIASGQIGDGELLSWLESLKTQGKVRAFGLATSLGESLVIAKDWPELARVFQIPVEQCSLVETSRAIPYGSCIVHGLFASSLEYLWNRRKTCELFDDKSTLAAFLLANSVDRRDVDVSLVSCRSRQQIETLVTGVDALDSHDLSKFRKWICDHHRVTLGG